MDNAAILFGTMFMLMLIGVPVVISMLAACAVLLITLDSYPLVLIPQRIIVALDSFPMLAAPLFILAGELMAGSSISKRLVDVVSVFFGRSRSGMGIVTIVACTIFAALTGSGPATVAAIGAVMMPALLKQGYQSGDAAGLIACGGTLGPIIPPSICMIVYACTMSQSVTYMFMGSIIPGLIIAAGLILTNMVICRKKDIHPIETQYSRKEVLQLVWRSLGVLATPVLVLGSIYGGIATPTEAAVLACVYSGILGFFYKDLDFPKLLAIIRKSVAQSAVLSIILGASGPFGWVLSATKVPTILTEAFISYIPSPNIYLALFTILLFILGAIMYNIPVICILGPVLVPVGVAMGLDPLHLGIVFCINLIIGFVTPPFGINLFAACATTGDSYANVVKGAIPYIIVEMVIVVILTYVPYLSLVLPKLFYGYGG